VRGSTRKGKRAGLALIEVVLVVFALAVVAALVLPRLARPRKESTRIRCRHVLYRLAKGMRMYPNEHGDNAWYPCPLGRGATPGDYNGAEWLASLYWTGIVSDPGVFICPSSPDQNDAGRDIGTHHAVAGRFGSQTVSYAGMYYGGARAIGRAGSFPAPSAPTTRQTSPWPVTTPRGTSTTARR